MNRIPHLSMTYSEFVTAKVCNTITDALNSNPATAKFHDKERGNWIYFDKSGIAWIPCVRDHVHAGVVDHTKDAPESFTSETQYAHHFAMRAMAKHARKL